MTKYEFDVAYSFTCTKRITVKSYCEEDALEQLKSLSEKIIDDKQIKLEECTRPIKTLLTIAGSNEGGYFMPGFNLTDKVNRHFYKEATKTNPFLKPLEEHHEQKRLN